MLPDRVSNPGPLTYESGALPIALRGLTCPREIENWLIYCLGSTDIMTGLLQVGFFYSCPSDIE